MPNHVRIIVEPAHEDGLRQTFAEVHRRYTGTINARNRWTGHLWLGRFGCVAMDEIHLVVVVRYMLLNPVRAWLVKRPQDWKWSSVHALLDLARGDGLTAPEPVLDRLSDIAGLLQSAEDEALTTALRRAESVGRPLGDSAFLDRVATLLGRDPKPQKRGPKPREGGEFGALSP